MKQYLGRLRQIFRAGGLLSLALSMHLNLMAQLSAFPDREPSPSFHENRSLLFFPKKYAWESPSASLLLRKDSSQINKKRLKAIWIGGSAFYVGTMVGLYTIWYQGSEQRSFHFFNDNAQWLQMDKVGHFYSAYHFSRASMEAFRWAGMSERKAALWGTLSGIILMTPIEILDGFSADFGASWGDFLANTGGALFSYGQIALWNEIRIHPKFSFHRTAFPAQRPEILGRGFREEIVKDYNGQTYWLSFDIDKFMPQKRFPKWLNIAVGYGAENMLYAREAENRDLGQLNAFRQYYLGIDFDLSAIRTRSKVLNTLLYLANLIRLPAPTLEYSRPHGLRFRAFFF